jgi:hypothetical protein
MSTAVKAKQVSNLFNIGMMQPEPAWAVNAVPECGIGSVLVKGEVEGSLLGDS